MTLLAIVIVLLLEQARPLPVAQVDGWLKAWADQLDSRCNAGEMRQGVAAWLIGAALPASLVAIAYILAAWFNSVAGLLISVAVLYLTTGFRHVSHFFTDIHLALRAGELDQARRLLSEWRGMGAERLGSEEIARLSIEQALLSAHRHVFAPLFWFVLLGPGGALLYRLSRHFSTTWGDRYDAGRGSEDDGEADRFGEFSRRAFAALDWLPVRLTAASFAVVGDFESAVYCWRSQAGRWPDQASGILLSSGAGALGVRLGMPVDTGSHLGERPELGMGEEADSDFMQSTVGLVWRTLVMALLLLTLLGIASWV